MNEKHIRQYNEATDRGGGCFKLGITFIPLSPTGVDNKIKNK